MGGREGDRLERMLLPLPSISTAPHGPSARIVLRTPACPEGSLPAPGLSCAPVGSLVPGLASARLLTGLGCCLPRPVAHGLGYTPKTGLGRAGGHGLLPMA